MALYVYFQKLLLLVLFQWVRGLQVTRCSSSGVARFVDKKCVYGDLSGLVAVNEIEKVPGRRTGVFFSNSLVRTYSRSRRVRLCMVEVPEFGDEDEEGEDSAGTADLETKDDRTDKEKGLTHGYEGDFKPGDAIRVKTNVRIYSVKPLTKDGFDSQGLEGTINALILYGRKKDSLCSAITPIKVKFEPGSPGVPPEIERGFFLHFDKDEIERV